MLWASSAAFEFQEFKEKVFIVQVIRVLGRFCFLTVSVHFIRYIISDKFMKC